MHAMHASTSALGCSHMDAPCMSSARRCSPAGQREHSRRVTARAYSQDTLTERVQLGKSGLEVSSVGLGAWSWGDRSGYWGWEKGYGRGENLAAYKEMVESTGIDFLDTAEVYGFGLSETLVGEFVASTGTGSRVKVATKFAPLPWRQTPDSLVDACKASLQRLQLDQTSLYIQHWPGFFLNALSNDAHLEGLARVAEQGLAQAVGVSNFNAERVRRAARVLADRGTCLSSNQVQYSLLYRKPESNGVLEACRESGSTLVAYSPLCQGLLTGKYSKDNKPRGPRGASFTDGRLAAVGTLVDLMRIVGQEHGGKSPTQVAVNWLMCQPGVLPIPGAKDARQVQEIAGAMGWRLTDGEVAELTKVSDRIPSSTGAPFENW